MAAVRRHPRPPKMYSAARPERSNFDLFMRLMDEKRYEGLLFGEISATTQRNRLPRQLESAIG